MFHKSTIRNKFETIPQAAEIIKQATTFHIPYICSILIVLNGTVLGECLDLSIDCDERSDFPIIFRALDNLGKSVVINEDNWKLII